MTTSEIVISDEEQKMIEDTLFALRLNKSIALPILEALWKAAYSSGRIKGVEDVENILKGEHAKRQIQ